MDDPDPVPSEPKPLLPLQRETSQNDLKFPFWSKPFYYSSSPDLESDPVSRRDHWINHLQSEFNEDQKEAKIHLEQQKSNQTQFSLLHFSFDPNFEWTESNLSDLYKWRQKLMSLSLGIPYELAVSSRWEIPLTDKTLARKFDIPIPFPNRFDQNLDEITENFQAILDFFVEWRIDLYGSGITARKLAGCLPETTNEIMPCENTITNHPKWSFPPNFKGVPYLDYLACILCISLMRWENTYACPPRTCELPPLHLTFLCANFLKVQVLTSY